jgi:hypothetical protein
MPYLDVYTDLLVELSLGTFGELLWQTSHLRLLHSFALCLLHLGRDCTNIRESTLVEHYWCFWRQCI